MNDPDHQRPADNSIATGRSAQIAAVQARLGRLAPSCPFRPDAIFVVNGGFRHVALGGEWRLRSIRIPNFDGDFLAMNFMGSISYSARSRGSLPQDSAFCAAASSQIAAIDRLQSRESRSVPEVVVRIESFLGALAVSSAARIHTVALVGDRVLNSETDWPIGFGLGLPHQSQTCRCPPACRSG